MKSLPFKAFELSTNLSLTEVIERIISNTIVENKEHFKQYKRLFKGVVLENSFNISRVLSYRNSFKADVFGLVNSSAGETHVIVTMKLHRFVSVFLSIWCVLVGLALLVFLVASIKQPKIISGCLVSLFMLTLGYGLAKISFNYDAEHVKKNLMEILEAKEKV